MLNSRRVEGAAVRLGTGPEVEAQIQPFRRMVQMAQQVGGDSGGSEAAGELVPFARPD